MLVIGTVSAHLALSITNTIRPFSTIKVSAHVTSPRVNQQSVRHGNIVHIDSFTKAEVDEVARESVPCTFTCLVVHKLVSAANGADTTEIIYLRLECFVHHDKSSDFVLKHQCHVIQKDFNREHSMDRTNT